MIEIPEVAVTGNTCMYGSMYSSWGDVSRAIFSLDTQGLGSGTLNSRHSEEANNCVERTWEDRY